VTYAAAPLFHVGALNSFVVRTIVRGGTVVIRRSFDPQQFLDDLVEHRVNSLFAVPAMLAGLSRVPGVFDADLSALRSVVVAGAPVPPSLIRLYAEHGIWLQQAWGLTETAPFATHLPVEYTLDKVGSAGIAMPYTEVRIVDTSSTLPVGPGTAGEIVVRGANVTPGYWENSEATAAAFDEDGWFHSGDIGYLDADGYLFIIDRLKDMVITGGENVYPAEVERVLANMPGVTDVAVVGAPDEKWGEVVVAVVSPEENVTVTLDDVRDYATTELARYKLPQQLRIVDRVPRNASGKLEKLAIRQIFETGARDD
ncbi:AMP-binding protein, partial [Streptomyces sp. NPDC058171]